MIVAASSASSDEAGDRSVGNVVAERFGHVGRPTESSFGRASISEESGADDNNVRSPTGT